MILLEFTFLKWILQPKLHLLHWRIADNETVLESSISKSSSGPREKQKKLNRRTASVAPKFHKVRRGETLLSISRKYDITPKDLAEFNDFSSWKTRVKIGQKLALTGSVEAKDLPPSIKVTHKPITYKVQAGDHLTNLAEIFKSSVKEFKQTNKLLATHNDRFKNEWSCRSCYS